MRDRLDLPFEDLGEQEVKNIARPVRVWQLLPAASAAAGKVSVDVPLPLSDKPSIAVLPFDNMSGDPNNDHICDGLTETIISSLAKVSELLVIARNSTFVYRGRAVDIQLVARETGARYVLEGSVQLSGRRVRATAQLIDTETSAHIWSEIYNLPVVIGGFEKTSPGIGYHAGIN